MSARRRTPRGERRRRLGQNFLSVELAERLVAEAGVRAGELVVEIGPGLGPITAALGRRRARVVAVEIDPALAGKLRARLGSVARRVDVVEGSFFDLSLPDEPFRVVGSLPFGRTTDVLRRLLDDPCRPLVRADLVVQWEVARKRAVTPPSTLLSTQWAPWWEVRLGRRIAAAEFRPAPRVDAAMLEIVRRHPPLLPPEMARPYARFVRDHWPFGSRTSG